MKLSKFLYLLLFLCGINLSFSQNSTYDYNNHMKRFSISSPDVYTFEKYELNPVNHFVGKTKISIPIFTIKTGDIEYPIELNYDAGGIKVDQVASNVGLGWNLSRAIITRTIQNANDFDNTGASNNPDYSSLPSSESQKNFEAFVDNGYTAKVGYFLRKLNNVKIDENNKQVDFLPDVYNFYSPEFSTKFFFDDITTPVEMEPLGTKINAVASLKKIYTGRGYYTSNTWYLNHDLYSKDFFSIEVISNKGIRYLFEDYDCAYTEQFQVGSGNNFVSNNYEKVDSPAQISAWQISEIMDIKSNKKIEFVYMDTHSNTNGGGPNNFDFKAAQMSYQYTTIPNTAPNYQNVSSSVCHYYEPWQNYIDNHLLTASARVDVKRKVLKRIVFDEGTIEFNYNSEGIGGPGVARMDVANGDFLTNIYVKDKHGKIIKQFNLNYGKFESNYNVGEFNPFSEFSTYRYWRLKLESVEEVGKPPYEFFYDESHKLPPLNSFSIDFCGYFNNSSDVINNSEIITQNRHPQLYYYPNEFDKSLLPFPVSSKPYTHIPGYFNREANNYAKTWSLIKIKYPTSGTAEIEYEPNSFKLWGQEINGGGVRIKKQTLRDENLNILKEMNYVYEGNDGLSSGTLFSYPFFGHPLQKFFNSNLVYFQDENTDPILDLNNLPPTNHPYNTIQWKLFDKSNLLEDITSSAFVGYSKVKEVENGNGRREFEFTSNENDEFKNKIYRSSRASGYSDGSNFNSFNLCMDEFLITNSAVGSNIFTDNGYKRGKLLSEKIFDEQNSLLKETNNVFEESIFNTFSYKQPSTKQKHTQSQESVFTFIISKKDYKIANFLLKNKIVKNYEGPIEFVTNEEFNYNNYGFMTSSKTIDSKGDVREAKYYYPLDVTLVNSLSGGDLTNFEKQSYQAMCNADRNQINVKIQEEKFLNNEKLETHRLNYSVFNGYTGIIELNKYKRSFGNDELKTEFEVLDYDDLNGNPIWLKKTNGLNTVFIWGYNQSKIIAKFENLNDASLISQATIDNLQLLSNNDNDNCKDSVCNEQLLRNELNNLRNNFLVSNPNVLITTYTYDPLIGVTSITDPKGKITFYEYDSMGRLKATRDHNDNIEAVYDYNFKNN